MIGKKIEEAINSQINFEYYSAYLYKAMGFYCDSLDLKGFANWFKVQVEEETFHGDKLYNYLIERGGRAFLAEIPEPPKDWKSLKDAFENALKHEQIVTKRLNDLMTLALEEKDHATVSFLNWFIDEQVEEEGNVDEIIKQLNFIEESKHAIFMMDKELATRTFVAPVK